MTQRMWQRGPDGEIVRASSASEEPAKSPEPQRPGRARLGLALRLGLRDFYGYLGSLLLLSVAWSGCTGVGLFGGQALGTLLFGALRPQLAGFLSLILGGLGFLLLGSPATAGIFRYARQAAARQDAELFDLAWGFRQGLGRALGLGTLQALGTLVLAGNCYFYVSQRWPVLIVLGAVFGYLLLFWYLASLYQWSLMIEQELSPVAAVRKSLLLVLDNFPYTLGLGAVSAFLVVICWGTMVGGVLVWPGAGAILHTQATRELLRKYRVLGPDPTLDPVAGETEE